VAGILGKEKKVYLGRVMTVANPFRLPRPHLNGITPKQIGRLAASPLAAWRTGFSREEALAHYRKLGGVLPKRPSTEPVMPNDVTLLSSEELGCLYAQFVAYSEWLSTETSLCRITADELEAYVAHVQAEIRLRKSGTVKDKDNKAQNSPEFIAVEQRLLVAKAKAELLRARFYGVEKCASALSREMSRRAPPNPL
jgi:hypothetical protein